MKIISLNIWGGHLEKELLRFVEKHKDIDVLCLQEVYYKAKKKVTDESRYLALNILSEIHKILDNHTLFFSPVVDGVYGLAILVKSDYQVLDKGTVNIYHNSAYPGIGPAHSRVLQHVTCKFQEELVTIVNVHGLWNGMGKGDSPDRIQQSLNIKKCISGLETPVVLCGDFNLLPSSESFKILEEGMQNCISQYNITSTRTSYYPKEIRFADYMLLSKMIKIKTFKVLPDEVSDHTPLYLDFSLDKAALSLK